MARLLRSNRENGWYHVFHRGIERCDVFLDGAFGGLNYAVVCIAIRRLERKAATATSFGKYMQQTGEMLNVET